MRRKFFIGKMIGVLWVVLVLFVPAGLAEEVMTEAGGQWTYVLEDGCATITGHIEYVLVQAEKAEPAAELAGAWRTAEDDEGFSTLILYPDDAFRLYRYHKEDDVTFMLEGVRVVAGNTIIVSDVRLGILESDGVYAQTGEQDISRYVFSLVFDDSPALTLTDEKGDTITLFPADLDSLG